MNNLHARFYEKIGKHGNLSVVIVLRFDEIYRKSAEENVTWCVGTEDGNRINQRESSKEEAIRLPLETQWLFEGRDDGFFTIYVREGIKNLQVPVDDCMNEIINQKVKELQEDYQRRKDEEKRLYFYRAQTKELKLYVNGSCWRDDCSYSLMSKSRFHEIDEHFPVPKKDCFILGRVCHTVATRKGRLDFIQPIARFKAEKCNFFSNRPTLGNQLFAMLKFSIQNKEPSALVSRRIINKTRKPVSEFLRELKVALENGDVKKIKAFYEVVKERQDCSKEKFEIQEDKCLDIRSGREISCEGTRKLWIFYENGEEEQREARWIAENISRCMNKKVRCGENYCFY